MLWRPRSAVHCGQSVGNKIGRHVYVYRRGPTYLLACLCDANTITNDSFLRRECFSAWAGRRMLCDRHGTASQRIAHVLSVHRGAAPLIRLRIIYPNEASTLHASHRFRLGMRICLKYELFSSAPRPDPRTI